MPVAASSVKVIVCPFEIVIVLFWKVVAPIITVGCCVVLLPVFDADQHAASSEISNATPNSTKMRFTVSSRMF